MIVVADTSPLNYLLQIGCIDLLPKLYGRIVLPDAVLKELSHPGAPLPVRKWTTQIPSWAEIGKSAFPTDITLAFLGIGEREAIQFAQENQADLILIDERKGSVEAERRGLRVTGTLGVLLAAATSGFVDARQAYRRLIERTSFRSSPTLEAKFLAQVPKPTIGTTAGSHPTPNLRLPSLILHCDWGTAPNKRWMAKATLSNGEYTAHATEPVGNLVDLLPSIAKQSGPQGTALIGFDFPIGLPASFAQKAGVPGFLPFLATLQPDSPFFQVCTTPNEIDLTRPFYPNSPGGTKRIHLTEALALPFADLFRACDQPQPHRPAASAIFWTMGAQQVGKAAISGWRDLLAPALRTSQIQIWPFHGPLDSLLETSPVVAAETYPAHYYSSTFDQLKGSKTNQAVRAAAAPAILDWAASHSHFLKLDPSLVAEIRSGFKTDDAFDAAIGLFGMIDALQNYGPRLEPKEETIRHIEGWIFGQPAP